MDTIAYLQMVGVICLLSISQVLRAQDCNCTSDCPNHVGFTNCGTPLIDPGPGFPIGAPATSVWRTAGAPTNQSQRLTIDVQFTSALNQYYVSNIEVDFCCRVRENCPSFFTNPTTGQGLPLQIKAACEMVVNCIKIPKTELGDLPAGLPPNPPFDSDLIYAIMEKMLCLNPCQFGIPGDNDPSSWVYEWVLTIPACINWTKEGTTPFYCLVNCNQDVYCVHSLLVGNNGSGNPVLRASTYTLWEDNRDGSGVMRCDPNALVSCRENHCARGLTPNCMVE